MMVQVVVNDSQKRQQYLLQTLLSVIGVPYEISAISHQPSVSLTLTLSQREREISAILSQAEREAWTLQHPTPSSGLRTQDSGLDDLFATLARAEEYAAAGRDKYDRFQWANTTAHSPEEAVRPVVSEYARLLLDQVREASVRAGLPMIRKELWPEGKLMAACLTHDVDTIRRGKLPRGVAARDVLATVAAGAHGRIGKAARHGAAIVQTMSGPNPYWTFDRIAAIEREHGYRSTYFVMAGHLDPQDASYDPSEPRMRRLMREIVDSGCEVALHGSFASYTNGESLVAQKARLETILGRRVAGHRNHLLRFRAPESWKVQEVAGLSYDATLGFAEHEGYRGGHAFPFHPYDISEERPLELLEIPLAVMDATLYKYRGLRASEARQPLIGVLEQTLAVGGLATLLWHNDTYYEPDYPGYCRLYEEALGWLASHDAWVATCDEVDRWWRARDTVRLLPLPDGGPGWVVEAGRSISGLLLRVSLPDPGVIPRVTGQIAIGVARDGADYLLRLGQLPAGSRLEIRW